MDHRLATRPAYAVRTARQRCGGRLRRSASDNFAKVSGEQTWTGVYLQDKAHVGARMFYPDTFAASGPGREGSARVDDNQHGPNGREDIVSRIALAEIVQHRCIAHVLQPGEVINLRRSGYHNLQASSYRREVTERAKRSCKPMMDSWRRSAHRSININCSSVHDFKIKNLTAISSRVLFIN